MALDPVPWFVGAGARHSAAAARNLAWNATGSKTGIATPTSLHVKQTSTPGGNVQVMPGGCVIESTYQGALQQSYTIRNASATSVAIPPNTTGSTRTHYITAEVNDPTYAGGNPPSVENGPYNHFRVRTSRQSVHPELHLATVKVPPNTSVITNAMITDARVLANPRREELVFGRPRVAEDGTGNSKVLNGLVSSGGEYFPGGGGSPNTFTVTVPEWATRIMIEGDWMAVNFTNDNAYGTYWVEFGDEYRPHTWPNNKQLEFATQHFRFNSPAAGNDMRIGWRLMDAVSAPKKLRGKEVTFAFKAGVETTAMRGRVSMDGYSGLGCRLTFAESPETADLL